MQLIFSGKKPLTYIFLRDGEIVLRRVGHAVN